MKELPENVNVYKRTPDFNQETIPTGLLKATQRRRNLGKNLRHQREITIYN